MYVKAVLQSNKHLYQSIGLGEKQILEFCTNIYELFFQDLNFILIILHNLDNFPNDLILGYH